MKHEWKTLEPFVVSEGGMLPAFYLALNMVDEWFAELTDAQIALMHSSALRLHGIRNPLTNPYHLLRNRQDIERIKNQKPMTKEQFIAQVKRLKEQQN